MINYFYISKVIYYKFKSNIIQIQLHVLLFHYIFREFYHQSFFFPRIITIIFLIRMHFMSPYVLRTWLHDSFFFFFNFRLKYQSL